MLRTFNPGGIHLSESKITAASPIEVVDLPVSVVLPLAQSIGAPALPVVEVGQEVARGQMIARTASRVSAALHTPISGKVKAIGVVPGAFGYDIQAITIESTPELHEADMASFKATLPVDIASANMSSAISAQDILSAVSASGIVGMGGATFPTEVKLAVEHGKVDTLVVNAAECEPYLTCDHALMLSAPRRIIAGVQLAMAACGAKKAIIGVEANKADAVALLQKACDEIPEGQIRVQMLRERYPQGGEKQLIYALTRRRVPDGGLPAQVGVVVLNVATVCSIYNAVSANEPLISRIVTITGPNVPNPGNFYVPIGYPIDQLLAKCGIEEAAMGKVILGGPMMGRAAGRIDIPVTKGTSGVLVLPPSMVAKRETEACVRCARCVQACPMGLEPYLISSLSRLDETQSALDNGLLSCIECGSCSYVCPSSRPLIEFIRYGKQMARKKK